MVGNVVLLVKGLCRLLFGTRFMARPNQLVENRALS